MKDHEPPQSFQVSMGEIRYAPAAAKKPRMPRIKPPADTVAVTWSALLNGLIIFVLVLVTVFTIVELRRDVAVIETIRLPATLQEMGYTEQVAADRLWDAVAGINEAAQTAKQRVNLMPTSQRVDFVAPGAGISLQSIVQFIRGFLALEQTRIAGEFICGAPACQLEGLSLRLRVFLGERTEIISVPPRAEGEGGIDRYFQEAALGVLRHLDPFIVASYLYGVDREAARQQALALADSDHPERKWALNMLGMIAVAAGRPEDAIDWYRRAIDADERFALARFNWGVALHGQGDLDAAIAKYREVTAIDPDDVPARFNWGLALYTDGDLDGAIEQYRRVTEIDPGHALAHTNWGLALHARGDVEGAIAKYRRATEIDAGQALAYNNWGNALFEKNDLEGAIAKYRRTVELDSAQPGAHFNMALALMMLERPAKATEAFERYLALVPDADNATWVRAQIATLRAEAKAE